MLNSGNHEIYNPQFPFHVDKNNTSKSTKISNNSIRIPKIPTRTIQGVKNHPHSISNKKKKKKKPIGSPIPKPRNEKNLNGGGRITSERLDAERERREAQDGERRKEGIRKREVVLVRVEKRKPCCPHAFFDKWDEGVEVVFYFWCAGSTFGNSPSSVPRLSGFRTT